MKVVQSSMDDYYREWILVIYNASINKSLYIKEIIKNKRIRLMFITPNEPSLNPAEKLIIAIKNKFMVKKLHEHALSLDSVRDVVEQVVHTNFKKLINMSLEESINKMKSYFL